VERLLLRQTTRVCDLEITDFGTAVELPESSNGTREVRPVRPGITSFRFASGIRVKRSTTAPSLVAMTETQVPIIGWKRRYGTPQDCAFKASNISTFLRGESPRRKALGNAVNAKVVREIPAPSLRPRSRGGRPGKGEVWALVSWNDEAVVASRWCGAESSTSSV
jgi:hypothetical protein